MPAKTPFVLLLTGAPGAGKSEMLTHVQDGLAAAGIHSAAIDVDELARTYPPTDAARHLRHVASMADSYRDAGHELLLIAAAAESDADLRAWLDAAGAERRLVVHLIAGPATLEERVRERESPEWIGLPELLESARALASVRFTDTDLEVDTSKHEPREVADSILAQLRRALG